MGKGIIKLSLAHLQRILKLPAEYTAHNAYYSIHDEQLHILIEHESIPPSDEGLPFPIVKPIYQQKASGEVILDHIEVHPSCQQ